SRVRGWPDGRAGVRGPGSATCTTRQRADRGVDRPTMTRAAADGSVIREQPSRTLLHRGGTPPLTSEPVTTAVPGRRTRGTRGFVAGFSVIGTSVFQAFVALNAAAMVTAVSNAVFWVAAARLSSRSDLGLVAAVTSILLFVLY